MLAGYEGDLGFGDGPVHAAHDDLQALFAVVVIVLRAEECRETGVRMQVAELDVALRPRHDRKRSRRKTWLCVRLASIQFARTSVS